MDLVDPKHLLETFGTIGLIAIVFAESGLLVGFFLPGDSLLVTAGVFAAKGDLTLPVILVGCFLAAVIGDQVGYAFGARVGPALFRRPDSRLFKREYVEKAHGYFEKYGAKTIVIARFIPVVRTFAPVVAGVGSMSHRTFTVFNIAGGLLWTGSMIMIGFILGNTIDIDRYLLPLLAGIVFASVLPPAIEVWRSRRNRTGSPSKDGEPVVTDTEGVER